MTRSVTVATMNYTDGTVSRYGVYHATLYRAHLPTERQFIDLHRAEQIGSITHRRDAGPFDYFAAALRFQSPGYPAFTWPTPCTYCRRTASWIEDHDPACPLLERHQVDAMAPRIDSTVPGHGRHRGGAA